MVDEYKYSRPLAVAWAHRNQHLLRVQSMNAMEAS